jgi:hypothetical protein
MPSATVQQQMPAASAEVFALLHDYSRRLEWDPLLKKACLTGGHTQAALGATSLCVGKPYFGLIGIETRYITFKPGELAAVQMINRPPFFGHFAASIRHQDNEHGSIAVYKLQFTARPRFLRWLLHPIMLPQLRSETHKRLQALASFLARKSNGPA